MNIKSAERIRARHIWDLRGRGRVRRLRPLLRRRAEVRKHCWILPLRRRVRARAENGSGEFYRPPRNSRKYSNVQVVCRGTELNELSFSSSTDFFELELNFVPFKKELSQPW